MRSTEDVNRAVNAYADMVRRICFVHLKNRHDTEDVFQNIFLKYLLYEGSFESGEHEKAWFVRVTVNACTDWLRALSRRRWVSLDALAEESAVLDNPSREILEAVLKLPEKYRDVIYLFYYEEYSAVEIAKILGRKENTIYTWLSRAKDILREKLGGEWS
ncbi:MAG: sigma-70 family RNA polymerase sigma factor [Lachnospiraceae bacterium]|nr:sigma-70 family RNA polymerase sigma factor [Lachnospiraceae bacterium]MDE7028350.1 sigma-70 family RNA polymerase sigma factor [Lachnospiraceae bacterium]